MRKLQIYCQYAVLQGGGANQYSSDVLIGLQLKGTGRDSFDVNEAKSRNPGEIELVVLKIVMEEPALKWNLTIMRCTIIFKKK